MNGIVVLHHFIYVLISVSLIIWVGNTLFKDGRVFLVDSFNGNKPLADSVNHLVVVGFYLINFGIVSLFLRYGARPSNIVDFIELMSIKVGVIFLLLGLMHFINLGIFKVVKMTTPMENGSLPDPAVASRFFGKAH